MALNAAAAPKKEKTIGDLRSRPWSIRRTRRWKPTPRSAMDNYRRFLELQKTDPQLRAEALRRLGDLQLEAGELERMAAEVDHVDLQGAEAIKLYSSLLKAYPDYPRNDQVLYQLARAYETTGQPEKALATLDDIVRTLSAVAADRRSAVPPRRAAVLRAAITAPRRTPMQSSSRTGDKSAFLPAEPLQAGLVAVQAEPQRREPAAVRGRARSQLLTKTDKSSCRSRSCRAPTASSSTTRCAS